MHSNDSLLDNKGHNVTKKISFNTFDILGKSTYTKRTKNNNTNNKLLYK